MRTDEAEPRHIEPSLFVKAFSYVGAFVAISAVAVMIAFVLVTANKWYRYEYSIYGLSWGVCARLFDLSVRQGIKQNLASPHLTMEKRKALGEQLTMLRVTRWFVRLELIASGALLIVELLAR